MKLIPHWKAMWRSWSVQINALGLAILAWFTFDPIAVLSVWNAMPSAVHDLIPEQAVSGLGAIIFGLAMIARLVHQPKLQEKRNGETS
ncbi:hypothetical protein [Sphingopyxis witflariensis]|uniref:Holin n=1 Tax=Sphingopyxis witflariensis TaxID=173675 RepID=A0A246JYE2_9SPHN|nr:hypothetical protein [Sphingopyxis witflariensis]OWQ98027.1 hypothetical protein CDQ91_10430 [Sphingopyxis witflariensis]